MATCGLMSPILFILNVKTYFLPESKLGSTRANFFKSMKLKFY